MNENGIEQQNVDERIKKIYYKNMDIIGFDVTDSGFEYQAVPFCKFLQKFSKGTQTVTSGCVFGWDNSACLLIASKKLPRDADHFDETLDMTEDLKDYAKRLNDGRQTILG